MYVCMYVYIYVCVLLFFFFFFFFGGGGGGGGVGGVELVVTREIADMVYNRNVVEIKNRLSG